jgi:hypothetical protein
MKKIALCAVVIGLILAAIAGVSSAGPHDTWPPITPSDVRTSGPGPF